MVRRLAPAVVAAALLAACGSGSSDGSARDGSVPDAPVETGGGSAVIPVEVPEALRFAAPLIGGGDIELATLAGRPVLLWFWAPW